MRDGARVTLRAIAPEDKPLLAAMVERLSDESSYRPFFTSKTELSPAELDYLVDVDHFAHKAIIAIDASSEARGVARYSRSNDDAEVAEARSSSPTTGKDEAWATRCSTPDISRAARGRTPVYALAQTNIPDTLRLVEGGRVGETRRGWTPGRSSSSSSSLQTGSARGLPGRHEQQPLEPGSQRRPSLTGSPLA